MSSLDGEDVEYLNMKFGEVKSLVKKEVDTLHGRINTLGTDIRKEEKQCRSEVDKAILTNTRDIGKNAKCISAIKERSEWLKWGLITVLGGLAVAAIGVLVWAARGGL